jgi:hypothetical protein
VGSRSVVAVQVRVRVRVRVSVSVRAPGPWSRCGLLPDQMPCCRGSCAPRVRVRVRVGVKADVYGSKKPIQKIMKLIMIEDRLKNTGNLRRLPGSCTC